MTPHAAEPFHVSSGAKFVRGQCIRGIFRDWDQARLLNLLHKLDAADRHRRIIEPFEPEHRAGPLLDSPMVLLNYIVEILARPHSDPQRQLAFRLQFPTAKQDSSREVPTNSDKPFPTT